MHACNLSSSSLKQKDPQFKASLGSEEKDPGHDGNLTVQDLESSSKRLAELSTHSGPWQS